MNVYQGMDENIEDEKIRMNVYQGMDDSMEDECISRYG